MAEKQAKPLLFSGLFLSCSFSILRSLKLTCFSTHSAHLFHWSLWSTRGGRQHSDSQRSVKIKDAYLMGKQGHMGGEVGSVGVSLPVFPLQNISPGKPVCLNLEPTEPAFIPSQLLSSSGFRFLFFCFLQSLDLSPGCFCWFRLLFLAVV